MRCSAHCDEVGEGVELFVHAAGVVPGLAEFAAAADVGDGEGDAAVEQAEAIRIESDGYGDAVAAIAVEKKRRCGDGTWTATAESNQ